MLRGNRLAMAAILLASGGRSLAERALEDEAKTKIPAALRIPTGFSGKEKAQWKRETTRFKK